MLPVIIPIQFKKIEGVEECLIVMDDGMQALEIRLAIGSNPCGFPVNDAGLNLQGQKGFGYPGILAGPVITPASV